MPTEFFIPIRVAPKQSTRSTIRWKWESVQSCPFCRKAISNAINRCHSCGAGWSGTSRIKTPFLAFHKSDTVSKNEQELLRWLYYRASGDPIDEAIAVDITVFQEWPKATSKKQRARGTAWNFKQPDRDNLTKQVQDLLEKAGFVANDSRIVAGNVQKQYADFSGLYVKIYDPGEATLPDVVAEFMRQNESNVA
jgi:Holliday junction resolvase RusA-like endonuclease